MIEVQRIIEDDDLMDLLTYAQCLLRNNNDYFTLKGRMIISSELDKIKHEIIKRVKENS